jgi:hypothetical protein
MLQPKHLPKPQSNLKKLQKPQNVAALLSGKSRHAVQDQSARIVLQDDAWFYQFENFRSRGPNI